MTAPAKSPMGWIDRLLPEQHRTAPDEVLVRARIGLTFAALTLLFFGTAAVLQFLGGNVAAAVLDLFCVVLTLVGVEVGRRTLRVALVVNLVLGLITVAVVMLAATSRGAGLSGATLVIAVMPMVATLMLGERAGSVWLIPSLSSGLLVGALGYFGVISNHLTGGVLIFNDHLVLAIFTVALFALASRFDRRKEESLKRITELEAQRHEAGLRELRSQTEAHLAQAEQYASLGRIAAATAHEINNPLAYLLGNLNFVKERTHQGDQDLDDALQESIEGAQRIRRIVSDLSAMTRTSNDGLQEVEVQEAVSMAISLATPQLATRAHVATHFEAVPKVTANEARLTRVLFNLLLNAAEGLPEGRPAEHEIDVTLRAASGQVTVEIADSGQVPLPRGLDEVKLAVILGETVVRSFGGTLSFSRRGDRSVTRVSLVATAEVS